MQLTWLQSTRSAAEASDLQIRSPRAGSAATLPFFVTVYLALPPMVRVNFTVRASNRGVRLMSPSVSEFRASISSEAMGDHQASQRISLALSATALIVSAFAAFQAYRMADANDRLLGISEEQVRPRLVFFQPSFISSSDTIRISVSVKNAGASTASVSAAKVESIAPEGGGQFEHDLEELNGAILYPGDTRSVTVTAPRLFFTDGVEVDYASQKPSDFNFWISYNLFGKPSMGFSEGISFSLPQWSAE